MIIRKAKPADAIGIEKVADSVQLEKLADGKNGFLMSNSEREAYEDWIRKSPYCYVAVEGASVVGFVIAYKSKFLDTSEDIHRFLLEKFKGQEFIYIFQIAIKPRFQRSGVGRRLYEKLFSETKGEKIAVVTSAKPYNRASEAFQLKLGFKKIDRFAREDGGESFVYELNNGDIKL
jgi:ribosomal protein S18 acetylase RimI-like enzyme